MYWYDLSRLDRHVLEHARLQTHYALQWLARIGRSYCGTVRGEGDTSLLWHDGLQGFLTRDLSGSLRFGLRVEDLTYFVFLGEDVDAEFSLDGVDDAAVGAWIKEQLSAFDFPTEPLFLELPYKLPEHAVAQGAAYDPISNVNGFVELGHWLSNGWSALTDLQQHLAANGFAVTPIRCWPHSFRMSFLISLGQGQENQVGRIQVGLCPGNELAAEPYFYVSPRPALAAENLPDFVDIGQWQVNGTVDAVAPASHFVGDEMQAIYVRRFLNEAVNVGLERLTR